MLIFDQNSLFMPSNFPICSLCLDHFATNYLKASAGLLIFSGVLFGSLFLLSVSIWHSTILEERRDSKKEHSIDHQIGCLSQIDAQYLWLTFLHYTLFRKIKKNRHFEPLIDHAPSIHTSKLVSQY